MIGKHLFGQHAQAQFMIVSIIFRSVSASAGNDSSKSISENARKRRSLLYRVLEKSLEVEAYSIKHT